MIRRPCRTVFYAGNSRIRIVLGVLAVSGLFVGVMNDAANFLNSAIGSKAAPKRFIMAVASVGIVVGAITSSGMMEVARSAMFEPAHYSTVRSRRSEILRRSSLSTEIWYRMSLTVSSVLSSALRSSVSLAISAFMAVAL